MGACCTLSNTQDQGNTGDLEVFTNDRDIQKSVVKIQTQFRGFKARKIVNDKRDQENQHSPPLEIAVPSNILNLQFVLVEKFPLNEIMTQYVAKTLQFLPKYKTKINIQYQEDLVKFGPVKFVKEESYYMGQWFKGKRWGKGQQVWKDGSYYHGHWKENLANGFGRLVHADGDCYEGEWVNDRAQGKGQYYHTDGAQYDGEWFEDQQHGQGKEVWPDKAIYQGSYSFGRKQGKGSFYWNDGSVYRGDYNNNNIEGFGVYEWYDGRLYRGEWLENKMHGKGIFQWPDGKLYEGQYFMDKKEGYGVLQWANGNTYKGEWRDGKQHGEGKMLLNNGKEYSGIWEYGKRVSISPSKTHLVIPTEVSVVNTSNIKEKNEQSQFNDEQEYQDLNQVQKSLQKKIKDTN